MDDHFELTLSEEAGEHVAGNISAVRPVYMPEDGNRWAELTLVGRSA
jgi:hypothetical protein